jgi:GR25 family glycosyltransferase involved in LPS biosynthesis
MMLKLYSQYQFYNSKLIEEEKSEHKRPIVINYLNSIVSFIKLLKSTIINKEFDNIIYNNTCINSLLNKPQKYSFNKGYYINLEHSSDRRNIIETIDFKVDMERFEATKRDNGNIGCSMSHIELLKTILKQEVTNENTYFMIIEDDLHILNIDKYNTFIMNINNMLSYHSPNMIILCGTDKIVDISSYYGFGFYKLLKSHTTSGYIVNYKFIPELLKKFETGLKNLIHIETNSVIERDLIHNVNCCDQIWNNNIINENWMFYYDMNVIQPNLSLNSTISYDYYNGEESKKKLLESFNSCFCLNNNFYPIRKEMLYHKQFDLLKYFIKYLENETQIKIKYVNEILI